MIFIGSGTMNDAWKIVQGLKKQNQNDSLMDNGITFSEQTLKKIDDSIRERERSEWDFRKKIKDNLSDEIPNINKIYFEPDSNKENEFIDKLKKFIVQCNINNKPISGKIGNIQFSVDRKNFKKISFFNETGNFLINIDGEDKSSEVSFIKEQEIKYICNSPINLGNTDLEYLILTREITITNGEEIKETYYVDDDSYQREELQIEVLKYILDNNPEFKQEGNDGIYRLIVNPDEELKKVVQPESRSTEIFGYDKKTPGVYSENLLYISKEDAYKTYNEYVLSAKQIEKYCEYIYSIIIKTYSHLLDNSLSLDIPAETRKLK